MAAFALKHVGNRAFIAMLHSVGELTTHLGLFELGSAGAELVVGAGVELAVSSALESTMVMVAGPLSMLEPLRQRNGTSAMRRSVLRPGNAASRSLLLSSSMSCSGAPPWSASSKR